MNKKTRTKTRTVRLFKVLTMVIVLLMSSCYKDDINNLKKQSKEQGQKLELLLSWQATVNNEITTLKNLLNAIEARDYVTNVEAVEEGLKISFKNSAPVIVNCCGDGQLLIGVELIDGVYYWAVTVGGKKTVITDIDGRPLVATGPQGPAGPTGPTGPAGINGVTPVIGLRAGNSVDLSDYILKKSGYMEEPTDFYWTISVNSTISDLLDSDGFPLKANGSKGDQGDSLIADIDNSNEKYVIITLNDGDPNDNNAGATVLELQKWIPNGIVIDNAPATYGHGSTTPVNYSFINATEPLQVFVLQVSQNWGVTVNRGTQTLSVTAPPLGIDDDKGWALLLGYDADQKTYTRLIELSTITRQVGDIFYVGGEPVGVVIVANDGTMNSGLVLSFMEGGPFEATQGFALGHVGIGHVCAWTKANDWANSYTSAGWFQANTDYYRNTLVPAIMALGGGDYETGLIAFNDAVVTVNTNEGTSYPLIKYNGDGTNTSAVYYWTNEGNPSYNADAWNFDPNVADVQNIDRDTGGGYARIYRVF